MKLRAELKEQQERYRELQEKFEAAINSKDEAKASETEGKEEDEGTDADVRNIAALQKGYEQLVSSVGAEDKFARDFKARIDTARSKLRANKPINAQIKEAERRCEKLGKLTEAAKLQNEELTRTREEIETKIKLGQKRIAELDEDTAKVKAELAALHKKAIDESGGATAGSTDAGTAWSTLMEETRKRVTSPGAEPQWAAQAYPSGSQP